MTVQTEGAPVAGSATTLSGVLAERASRSETQQTEQEAPETGADNATVTEPEESEGDTPPEETIAAPETDTGEGEAESEPAEQPTLTPPARWDAEAKALFAELPVAMQRKMLDRDKTQQAAITKAQQEAADARKQSQAETDYRTKLDTLLNQASKTFKGKWDGMTPESWNKWFQENPTEATKAKAQYDMERDELSRLTQAQQVEQQKAYADFVKAEEAKLAEVAPELADPEKGAERRKAVSEFLQSQGFAPAQLANITASELAIAHDAMRYRKAKEAMADPLKPVLKPVVKPAGTRGGNSNPTAHLEALRKKADSSGRLEDTKAYRAAKRRAEAR